VHTKAVVAATIFCLGMPASGQTLNLIDAFVLTAPPFMLQSLGFGDADNDSDVDLKDQAGMSSCISNSGPVIITSLACLVFDAEGDNDVDLADAAAFQRAFTGSFVCGDGRIQPLEQCDDGNTNAGDGCSPTCQNEATGIPNDNCGSRIAIGEGVILYSNVGATADGPDEIQDCFFFGSSQIPSDIWYCYTASCTGEAVISLCGSDYDTKMAVYSGCGCPSNRPLACSDDDCGTAIANVQSRVTINAIAGHSYMLRIGGYLGTSEQGQGRLTIRCGQDTCINGSGSCTAGHGDNQPGCNDSTCCNNVCEVDAYCCDVTWNSFCAIQAGGFCSPSGFSTCNAQAGACNRNHNGPGCNIAGCCNAVCQAIPECCINKWDNACVAQSELICTNCGTGRGDCSVPRAAPGCQDESCCAKVCAGDPFCCTDEWDITCTQEASELCQPN
jgi:cysteine-rich repeat protein